jgi:hypothetical protein
MMELISSPRTDYMLDVSLEALHAESRAWLSEINFWSEEMSCFYKLLHRSLPSLSFPPRELAEIEKEMIRINSDDLIKVKSQVERHERELAAVMKNVSVTEEKDYRHNHRVLLNDMYALQKTLRKFKTAVFALVKQS